MADLTLKDVPFFQRPLGATNHDIPRGVDELGNMWYENPSNGFRYSVQPNPDQRNLSQKTLDLAKQTDEWFRSKSLKGKASDVASVVRAIPSAIAGTPKAIEEDLKGLMSGKGTYGDATLNSIGVGATSAFGKVPKGALRTFGGRKSHKITGGDPWGLDAGIDYDLEDRFREAVLQSSKGGEKRDIWASLGWMKGKDGKWRFEISDKESAPFKNFSGHMTPREFWDTLDPNSSHKFGKLGDVLHHPNLYEHYPDLKDVNVVSRPGSGGHFKYETNTLSIGTDGDYDRMREQMLHEVQHAIQYKEGFSNGGNYRMFESNPKVIKVQKEWYSNHKKLRVLEREFEVLKKTKENLGDKLNNGDIPSKEYIKFLNDSKVIQKEETLRKLYIKENTLGDKLFDTKFNLYQSLYGEEEARAVAKRLYLTDKEKSNMFPEDSYRLSREYLDDNSGPSLDVKTLKPFKSQGYAEGGAVEVSPRPKQRGPELTGEYTIHGRPVWQRDGERYSEKTITINNGYGWIVVPTVDDFGGEIPHSKVRSIVDESGPYDFITGESLYIFDDVSEADRYAQERSDNMFNPTWKFNHRAPPMLEEPKTNNKSTWDRVKLGAKILGTTYLYIPRRE